MNDRDLQHPVISNMERTGTPDGKAPIYPRCPVCGAECETVYRSMEDLNTIVGCDECIKSADAWETSECFPEKE